MIVVCSRLMAGVTLRYILINVNLIKQLKKI